MAEPRLIGTGLLADGIARATARRTMTRPDERVVVSAADAWDVGDRAEIRAECAQDGAYWLPVRTELGRVVIGPSERPGRPGCVDCAELRRRHNRLHAAAHDAVVTGNLDVLAGQASTWLTGAAADVVAAVVVDEIGRLEQDSASARTSGALLFVDLKTLEVARHAFLPDPRCVVCGGLPADTPDAAGLVLESRPKTAPGSYRIRKADGHRDALTAAYVDAECGLIRLLARDDEAGSVIAAAWMGLRDGATEGGYGRTRSYESSERVAMLEALERHGGMEPGGRRTVVRGTYAELRDQALDPRELGLYPTERHRSAGFRYEPFEVDQKYNWVWGHSFQRRGPILVPEAYAYYRLHRTEGERAPFVYEISNGCALGACREEAILHGILEVAERDAFLMTWYARMAAPRIDLSSAGRRVVPLIVEAMRAETGYEVMAFDISVEQRIPCVWAMAVDPSDDAQRPKAVCAAGSHLDPETAAENALSELGSILPDLMRRYPDQQEQARRMVDAPSLVTEMSHHSLLYGTREAFSRLDHLVSSPRTVRFADMPGRGAGPGEAFRNADLSDDLRELAGRYLCEGLDVIVVDQSTPEHRARDLSCVKVIVPGTLPMTFGHDLRRVDGLPRLHEVPRRLGYRDRRLSPRDVNPHPHPFP
ncbi:TOMM precursor leader peptide-binding protein [Spirillospora sp. NBC_01491]|uniref:TOMM precursor leader peptide-binding protein n=1 Tax=Spirillospora sp. NBC_01491 TaxID=2976007 RepID=UPI002E354CEB|nr:TOMM precursor leader peptide-binding protein [Spirillospora sp. NBC_01491]